MIRFSLAHTRDAFGREVLRARRHVLLAYAIPAVPPIIAVTLFSDMMSPVADLPAFPNATFQDYMAPGAVLLSGMMMAGFTAVGVAEDRRSGFVDRLRLLGVAPISVTAGRLVFEAVRVVPAAAAAYALAVALGEDLGFVPADGLALVALGCVWAMAYNTLFHLVAHRTGSPHAPIALQPLFAVVTFPSTFWFPGDLMPSWGETMTAINPMSWLTDGARVFTTPGLDLAALGGGLGVIAATGLGLLSVLHLSTRSS